MPRPLARAILGVLGYILSRLGRFLRYRVGVRGLAILICSYIWALFSVGAFLDLTRVYDHTFHNQIPGTVRGVAWLASAGVGVWGCWIRMPQDKQTGERHRDEHPAAVALGVLSVMPVLHMVSFLGAWIFFGNWLAFYGGSFYLAAGTLVLLAAYIPVPRVPLPAPPTGDQA